MTETKGTYIVLCINPLMENLVMVKCCDDLRNCLSDIVKNAIFDTAFIWRGLYYTVNTVTDLDIQNWINSINRHITPMNNSSVYRADFAEVENCFRQLAQFSGSYKGCNIRLDMKYKKNVLMRDQRESKSAAMFDLNRAWDNLAIPDINMIKGNPFNSSGNNTMSSSIILNAKNSEQENAEETKRRKSVPFDFITYEIYNGSELEYAPRNSSPIQVQITAPITVVGKRKVMYCGKDYTLTSLLRSWGDITTKDAFAVFKYKGETLANRRKRMNG